MKKSLIHMITGILAAAPAPLAAQIFADKPAPAPAAVGATAAEPAAAPASRILKKVEFHGAGLSEVISYLQSESKKLGIDPAADPLNVVISPGLEGLILPTLSLRNVSPTDVLTVATTVLGLQLEPVNGDSGLPIAWLIKPGPSDPFGNPSAAGGGGLSPATAAAGLVGGAASGPGFVAGAGGFTGGGAGSAAAGGGGIPGAFPPGPAIMELSGRTAAAPAAPQARVFGIAALLKPSLRDAGDSEKSREERLTMITKTLHDMAGELCPNGGDVEIRPYNMDILVVRTKDPAALDLMASAIEAMKSNALAGSGLPSEKAAKP